MVKIKHYCDLPSGTTLELVSIHTGYPKDGKIPQAEYDIAIPFFRDGRWLGLDSDGFIRPVTRKIEYKSRPSLHECDARCMNGKCNGACECRCGGKNHGKGRVFA